MSTTINSNGSKWAGQAPDTLEQLYAVLQSNPLNPRFEEYGDFCLRDPNDTRCMLRFWGNFYNLSHVFSIDTDDQAVIDRIGAKSNNVSAKGTGGCLGGMYERAQLTRRGQPGRAGARP